jgi:hypothetical protein
VRLFLKQSRIYDASDWSFLDIHILFNIQSYNKEIFLLPHLSLHLLPVTGDLQMLSCFQYRTISSVLFSFSPLFPHHFISVMLYILPHFIYLSYTKINNLGQNIYNQWFLKYSNLPVTLVVIQNFVFKQEKQHDKPRHCILGSSLIVSWTLLVIPI